MKTGWLEMSPASMRSGFPVTGKADEILFSKSHRGFIPAGLLVAIATI
jgi:hypothetical protein